MADAPAFLRKRRIATLSLGLSTDEEGQNHAKETERFIRESGLLCRKKGGFTISLKRSLSRGTLLLKFFYITHPQLLSFATCFYNLIHKFPTGMGAFQVFCIYLFCGPLTFFSLFNSQSWVSTFSTSTTWHVYFLPKFARGQARLHSIFPALLVRKIDQSQALWRIATFDAKDKIESLLQK